MQKHAGILEGGGKQGYLLVWGRALVVFSVMVLSFFMVCPLLQGGVLC